MTLPTRPFAIPVLALFLGQAAASAAARFIPTSGAAATVRSARDSFDYDPTSEYDKKGLSAPRGFMAQSPVERVDPFSGNLVLRHTDLSLPGVAGLDLALVRVYNSKIHRNYATRVRGDASGMLFVPTSPLGLGWSLHLGRIVGGVNAGPNSALPGPRYYEKSDGSQHPFFSFTGPGCGNGSTDVCLLTKDRDNPYQDSPRTHGTSQPQTG